MPYLQLTNDQLAGFIVCFPIITLSLLWLAGHLAAQSE